MQFYVRVLEACDIIKEDGSDTANLCCYIQISGETSIQRTRIARNTIRPVWNEDFVFPIDQNYTDKNLVILIRDKTTSSESDVSTGSIKLSTLTINEAIDTWVTLNPCKNIKNGGHIQLYLQISNPTQTPFQSILNIQNTPNPVEPAQYGTPDQISQQYYQYYQYYKQFMHHHHHHNNPVPQQQQQIQPFQYENYPQYEEYQQEYYDEIYFKKLHKKSHHHH